MFVFDVDPGMYADDEITTFRPGIYPTTTPEPGTGPTTEEGPSDATTTTTPAPGPTNSTTPPPPPPFPENYNVPQNSRRPGVREVHATWNFNQDSCNFISKIHIQYGITIDYSLSFTI
jgi:hypothetical protein